MTIEQIEFTIEKVCKSIAPTWPLENSVAVNPFLGLTEYSFENVAHMLKQRGGINLYMPLNFYMQEIHGKRLFECDIERALNKAQKNETVQEFLFGVQRLVERGPSAQPINNVSDTIDKFLSSDYSSLVINHISQWMANYFKPSNEIVKVDLFKRWRQEATLDLFPELSGVINFRGSIQSTPDTSYSAILNGLEKLSVPKELLETYLHSLLLKVLGWASYCAGLDWQNRLRENESEFVKELLAVIISWENALLGSFENMKPYWTNQLKEMKDRHPHSVEDDYLEAQAILQDAFDFKFQRDLVDKLNTDQKQKSSAKARPNAQIIFCIDVRSEVFRRNIELVDQNIETIGFAGFFGFPIKYLPINHQKGKDQCPVLIPAGPKVYETTNQPKHLEKEKIFRRQNGRLNQYWQSFRSGSVSSFSFVSPLGLFYLPKLISDSFGWTRPTADPKKREFGRIDMGVHKLDVSQISFDDRLNMAHSALTSMGLFKEFAPLVLITGHGASSVNNPHATGLDCGACGGNSGEINALTAQLILNDKKIQDALKNRGIHIPQDTFFVACLHNTTTDVISVLNEKNIPLSHLEKLVKIKESLAGASHLTREARALRLGIKNKYADAQIIKRARDWGQVRPEWGLAGCGSFIIAPRDRTLGIDLEGKAFLHSYDWKSDKEFKILEGIMTAPMVVTSWINLQYYASTVDNHRLGAGNKTLHNVTSELGVLEGAHGDLRIGLPLQSIHSGKEYQHLPVRLNVIIHAPKEEISNVLEKHKNLMDLFKNHWINLFTTDCEYKVCFQYSSQGNWEKLELNTPKTDLKYQGQKLYA
jgi:uncharacterized protein YbcC (UPF0753/DUF2309 family)